MKLVDVLARELKIWPDQYYQIYQDSGGNLIGTLSDNDLEDCDSEDLPYDPVTIAWDGNSAIVGRAEWKAAVDALKAESAPTWTGEGLPPVGLVCERMWSSGFIEYVKVRIIAHDEGQAVFRFLEGLRTGRVQSDKQGHGDSLGNPVFRPIKTPEQIAAELECATIKQICDDLDVPIAIARKAFEKGYRKSEIIDEPKS